MPGTRKLPCDGKLALTRVPLAPNDPPAPLPAICTVGSVPPGKVRTRDDAETRTANTGFSTGEEKLIGRDHAGRARANGAGRDPLCPRDRVRASNVRYAQSRACRCCYQRARRPARVANERSAKR